MEQLYAKFDVLAEILSDFVEDDLYLMLETRTMDMEIGAVPKGRICSSLVADRIEKTFVYLASPQWSFTLESDGKDISFILPDRPYTLERNIIRTAMNDEVMELFMKESEAFSRALKLLKRGAERITKEFA